MNAIMKNKMALILTCLLLIVNHSYSQLPSFGDLGFMNTYKENKFYWGLSFDTCDKLKSIEQTKYKLVYKSGVLTKGKRIGAFDNDSNFYIKYDERGNIIAKQEYTSLGKQSRTYTHKYDECNNTFEVRGYNSDGEWVYLEKYTYNILGALIVEEYYDINTFKKYSHGYNENGNIIESLYTEIHGYPLM